MASLRKNVASQNITFQLTNSTTGAPVTAGGAGNVSKDGGAQAACTGSFTHLGTGQWLYVPTQAETNATSVGFQFTGTSAITINLQFFTDNWDTTQAVLTSGSGAAQIAVNGSGAVSTVTTVTNQLTASAIATGIWQDTTAGDFTTASSIGKSLYTSGAVPGASGGLFIAGSNAATTMATMTVSGATTLTGNVSMAAGLTITQSSSNAAGLSVTGNGTGSGAVFTSGSGATGDGVQMTAASTNGNGLSTAGVGTGSGHISVGGGASGAGIKSTGGSGGHGVLFTGGTGGDGIRATGGTSGNGLFAVGNAAGVGFKASGGATGPGISAVGGATSGDAILTSATSGHGMTLAGSGTTKHGLNATGGSTSSHGINATGGGTGHGILATSGGGATGDGIVATAASTNGNGMTLVHSGSGVDLNATTTTLAVASVVGAVASVTGNVGGNVVGSVGSVVGAVGSVTGNVGGNVTGSVGSLAAQAKTDVAVGTWEAVAATYNTAGSMGALLHSAASAGDPWSTAIPGAYVAGTAGFIVGNNLDAAISSRLSPTQTLTEAYPAAGASLNLTTALYSLNQILGASSIPAGTTKRTVFQRNGTTPAMTFTIDSPTAPTTISQTT